jgi:hypothetical protein
MRALTMTPLIANITCNALPGQPARITSWGCLCQQAIAHERTWQTICPCPTGATIRQENPDKWKAAQGKSIHTRPRNFSSMVAAKPNPAALDNTTLKIIEQQKERDLEAKVKVVPTPAPHHEVKLCPKHNLPIKYNAKGVSMGGCQACRTEISARGGAKVGEFYKIPPVDRIFEDFPEIGEWIKAQAADSIRTPEQQVVFICKQAMAGNE